MRRNLLQSDLCLQGVHVSCEHVRSALSRGPTSTHFTKSPLWTETCWPAPGRVTLNWIHFIEKVLRAGLQEMDRNGTKCLLQLTGGLVLVRGSAVQSEKKLWTAENCRSYFHRFPASIWPHKLPRLLPTIGHGHGTLLRQLFTSISPSIDLGAFAQPPGAMDQPFFGQGTVNLFTGN